MVVKVTYPMKSTLYQTAVAQQIAGVQGTVGGLNGKLSGKMRLKWKVPPLYGLSGYKEIRYSRFLVTK